MYKERERDASNLMKVVHIRGPREVSVTLLVWLGNVLFG